MKILSNEQWTSIQERLRVADDNARHWKTLFTKASNENTRYQKELRLMNRAIAKRNRSNKSLRAKLTEVLGPRQRPANLPPIGHNSQAANDVRNEIMPPVAIFDNANPVDRRDMRDASDDFDKANG